MLTSLTARFTGWIHRNSCHSRRASPKRRPSFRPRLESLERRALLAAGALDTSFGGDGFAQTAIGPITDYAPQAVAVQSDGKTVATSHDGYGNFAFVRYHSNGSLDTTFGSNGKAIVRFGMSSYLWALAIQPDGKIVGVGEGVQGSFGNFQGYNALVRLNANGSLDTTFGDPGAGKKSTGKVLSPIPPNSSAQWSVALQSDGRIIVGAKRSQDFAVYRYTTAGKLDSTFNGTGYVTTDFGGGTSFEDYVSGVAVQPDGRIVAVGRAGVVRTHTGGDEADFSIVRYNSNGTLDGTFGVAGKSQLNLSGTGIADAAQSVGIQLLPTGSFRIITSGYSVTADRIYQMTVAAVDASGNLDPTFGTAGVVKTPTFQLASGLSGTLSYGNSLKVQPDGKVVVGATSRTITLNRTVGFGLVRYTTNGALDTSFADNGISFTDQLNGKPILLSSIGLAADGRIVAAGQIDTNANLTNANDILVARYLSDPALQAPFAAPNPSTAILTGAQLQPLLNDAVDRWQTTAIDTRGLGNINVQIVNLGGKTLGVAAGRTIFLDDNAAGWGWFVDATPGDDSEFTTSGNQGEMHRMDLLSVLMHEIGHLLGAEHSAHDDDVMFETLAAGQRTAAPGHHNLAMMSLAADLDRSLKLSKRR